MKSEEWNQEERSRWGRGTERHIQVIDSERFVTVAALNGTIHTVRATSSSAHSTGPSIAFNLGTVRIC